MNRFLLKQNLCGQQRHPLQSLQSNVSILSVHAEYRKPCSILGRPTSSLVAQNRCRRTFHPQLANAKGCSKDRRE